MRCAGCNTLAGECDITRVETLGEVCRGADVIEEKKKEGERRGQSTFEMWSENTHDRQQAPAVLSNALSSSPKNPPEHHRDSHYSLTFFLSIFPSFSLVIHTIVLFFGR